jgi:BCD family chlorophyll transporter-like MFS transporter
MEQQQGLSTGRNLKIGLFHLGSGMADVITTGIWNRIMITDLGFSATPIGLLVALRYFLAPLGVWAGRMSDQHSVGGYQRLFWVWLGRAMMALSIAALGLTTAAIADGATVDAFEWIVITVAMLLFSLGSALSGGTFLALIYDRTTENQRGRAVGIVWTFLLIGFTIGGILFGVMLPSSPAGGEAGGLSFTPETLQNLFLVAAALLGGLWFFSLLGEERRNSKTVTQQQDREASTSLRADLKLAWSNRQTRFFFWYLALSMLFAFSQDLILEPFAGDVFHMEARITTRFAAYWGSMAILGTIAFLILNRRVKWLTNTVMGYIGVGVLIATFAVFAVSSFGEIRGLVTPGLILLGLGLGIWNVGTLGLMMDMSPFGRAGTFLGFWSVVVTLARGLGVSSGGVARDLMLRLTGESHALTYGIVFAIGAVGLAVSLWALRHVNVRSFKSEQAPADAATVFVGGMD